MEKWTTQDWAEASGIVARLVEVQKARKLSDRDLVGEYPELGSSKTWRQRLIGGSGDGLNPERTLAKLRRIAVVLEGGTPDAVFFASLPFAREVIARLTLLERSTTDRRILVVLAPNGTGKTTTARWAVSQSRSTRAYCRLRPGWRNKGVHIANGIARALGAEDPLSSPADAEQRLISLLSGQPRTVFLDQAHEGGPALMHLLRALVDETPSRFCYLGYDTAFRRVQTANTDALIEAQAFLGRCIKPIFDRYRTGTQVKDVSVFLQVGAGLTAATADSVAARVTPVLQRNTNLRLLDDAVARARAVGVDDDVDPATIVPLVNELANLDSANLRDQNEEAA